MSPLLSKNPIFDSNNTNLKESYDQFLSELRDDVSEDEVSPYLSNEFQEELKDILGRQELETYSPLKFYWLNLIDKIVDTLSLVEEGVSENNELIGFYSDSDLLGFIVDLVEKNEEPEDILEKVIDFQEIQIICFFHLHISKENWQPNGPVSYPLTPEIGETNGVLVLGEEKDIYVLEDYKGEAIIPVAGVFHDRKQIQIVNGDDVVTVTAEQASNLKHKIGELTLMAGFDKEQKADSSYFSKVEKALNVINCLSSDLSTIFHNYTHTIVPLYQEELVSYSMAILPGYSSINVRDRDFVDMVDDLLHENGHHFLNALLEGEDEIIYEDDDKIFYSPWRKALRPIRGLYHGLVTFYWAYRLFKELSVWEARSDHFSDEELQKVYYRFLEEAVLIRRCKTEIDQAYQLEKVTDFGMEVVGLVFKELEDDHSVENEVRNLLKTEDLQRLKELEADLNSKKLI